MQDRCGGVQGRGGGEQISGGGVQGRCGGVQGRAGGVLARGRCRQVDTLGLSRRGCQQLICMVLGSFCQLKLMSVCSCASEEAETPEPDSAAICTLLLHVRAEHSAGPDLQ